MLQNPELSREALDAELSYRRDRLRGTTYPADSWLRRMRHRRPRPQSS